MSGIGTVRRQRTRAPGVVSLRGLQAHREWFR